jgi:molybdenum cofactor cytidylyltransferase
MRISFRVRPILFSGRKAVGNMKKEQHNPESGIWAIILAGGESKRMKTPKMLLPFQGKTILEVVIENVVNSEVNRTVVVLGANHKEILNIIAALGITHCYNDRYKDGMLSSVKCGLRSLPAEFKSVLVFQGDQPMIRPETINDVIRAWKNSGKGITIPVYEKKRGHPLLVEKKYRNEIEKLNAEEGLHSLATKFHHDVFEIEVDAPGIIRDIDTREDYLNEIKQT